MTIMNTSKLMIGDIVSLGEECQYAIVKRIFTNSIIAQCEDSEELHFDYFWGLPITEEILRANGIEENEDINAEGVHYRKMASIWTDLKQRRRVYDINNDPTAMFSSNNIKYVHELQHALRLCGLNELADNFKIE